MQNLQKKLDCRGGQRHFNAVYIMFNFREEGKKRALTFKVVELVRCGGEGRRERNGKGIKL